MTVAAASGAALDKVVARVRQLLPDDAVISDHARLRTYECDGLAHYRVTPALVVIPEDTAQLAAVVKACAEHRIPYVARGSGTGLSGGALPHKDGVLIVTSRMRAIREVRREDQRAVVEPGVINLDVTRAATPAGYYYAPDPSSQQICSIGGNVAENSGGAHCLKYGFTTNHVLGAEFVTPQGEVVELGSGAPDAPGYDLLGAVVGSEGTLGIVTSATVRLVRLPEEVRTLLAGFESTDQAGAATSAIISAGILPAAIEMMDALAIEAAEEAVRCGYPKGAGAVLVIELDGAAVEVAQEYDEVERLCAENGAFEQRLATDPVDRALIWKGRKSAFAAVGRISPDYIVQDGVIPRTALPEVLRAIADLSGTSGVRVANVFHAGDGNLHPLVLFDESKEGEGEAAERVSGAILDLCIQHGGSVTGRARRRGGQGEVHVPHVRARMTSTPCRWCGAPSTPTTSPTRARCSRPHGCVERFPAATRAPTRCRSPAWRRSSGAMRDPMDDTARETVTSACEDVRTGGEDDLVDQVVPGLVARPTSTQQVAEVLRAAAAHGLTVIARGRGTKMTWGMPPSSADVLVDLGAMDQVLDHQAGDLIVETQAGVRLAELQAFGREGGTTPRARRDGARRQCRRHAGHQRLRSSAGAGGHRPRPAHRDHGGPRGRRGGQGRRSRCEERRRLRPGQAHDRIVRHPRGGHRGVVPAPP